MEYRERTVTKQMLEGNGVGIFYKSKRMNAYKERREKERERTHVTERKRKKDRGTVRVLQTECRRLQ